MKKLAELVAVSEDRIIQIVLSYALKMGYTKYTSTLEEAWRLSVRVLCQNLIAACRDRTDLLDFGPDEDFTKDPVAEFGIIEARRHRQRGISFGMFLGLLKYYRQAYIDLVIEAGFEGDYVEKCRRFIDRFYDRVELGLCVEWTGVEHDSIVQELRATNRLMTNDKNKYLTVFESLPQPGLLLNQDLRIDNLNLAALELLRGASIPGSIYYGGQGDALSQKTEQESIAAPILGHPVADFFPWLSEHIISFANGGSLSFSLETVAEVDSRKVYFEVLMSRMLDVSEKFPGLLILFTDVTERKLVERQLAQSQKLESIGQLAAGIAHEINTPTQYVNDNIRFIKESFDDLSGAMRMCHRLQAAAKSGEPTEALLSELFQELDHADTEYLLEEIPLAIDQCLEGLARVSDIVRSMKEFARPSLDAKSLVDINRAIESTVMVARSEWKYVAEVILDLAPDLPLVPCMAAEFNQVILNMVINAVHAIKDVVHDETGKGTIRIHTRQRNNDLEITITDTGAGIPAEIAERVFDPFFTTREPGKGMGQGLAMAYRVIKENHGGTITFTSTKNQGTTFVMHLPLE